MSFEVTNFRLGQTNILLVIVLADFRPSRYLQREKFAKLMIRKSESRKRLCLQKVLQSRCEHCLWLSCVYLKYKKDSLPQNSLNIRACRDVLTTSEHAVSFSVGSPSLRNGISIVLRCKDHRFAMQRPSLRNGECHRFEMSVELSSLERDRD